MLLRNRLKKEPANLLKSKNRIFLNLIIVYVIVELMIYMPGDIMSPGYSIVYGGTGTINNYKNVLKYPYSTTNNNYNLKDLEFSFVEEVSLFGDLENAISKDSQIPQGICITNDYYVITSYSENDNTLGLLRVYDIDSGEQLLTLGMDVDSHMGGVAFDGQNIWVCNSDNNTLERIPYKMIEYFILIEQRDIIDITNLVDSYVVDCIPSCITFYDGRLWVAQYNVITNSQMIAYQYDTKEDELIFKNQFRIPMQVQGVAFDENGMVYLSLSYGRKTSSYIKQYASVDVMDDDIEDCIMIIEMPPCSEELIYYEDRIYVLFESAGRKYLKGTDGLGQSICPLDKILIIDPASP